MTSKMTDEVSEERGGAGERKRPGRRITRKGALLFVLALCAGLGGLGYAINWWNVGRFIETTDDAYVGGDITTITPHVSGYIAEILVKDNQFVRAGQPLVRLEGSDFKTVSDAAASLVTERKAALERLRAQRGLEEALIRKAEADLEAKRASAEFKDQEAERYRNLARTEAGSQQNAERSRSASRETRAEVDSARAALEAAVKRLAVVDTQVAEAWAELGQSEAQQQTAQINLGYTEIRSPIAGYVGDRSAHPGTYVTAGTQLLSIVPANALWVEANFKEDQLRGMKPGAPVQVVADAARSQRFRGRVQSLAPATGAVFSVIPPQNATGNFTKIVQRVPVRITLDGDAATLGMLRPGLSTVVSVDTRPGGREKP